MDKILLVKTAEVINGSVIEDNVDAKLLGKAIGISQETGLKPILGNTLYNQLVDEVYNFITIPNSTLSNTTAALWDAIKPYLIARTVADFVIINNYKFTAKGLVKLNDNSSTALDNSDLENVKDYYNNLSVTYKEDLIKYLEANKLITRESNTDITNS